VRGAAHVDRVLAALGERGIAATRHASDPIRWDALCPCCGLPLEIRDVDWQGRCRRVRFFCARCGEATIVKSLALAEGELCLAGPAQPEPDWVLFRERIIARLNRIDRSRFFYIEGDRMAHVCPVCQSPDGWLSIHFLERTPTADIQCSLGCSDDELARALRLKPHA
jgi:hypothetical protein